MHAPPTPKRSISLWNPKPAEMTPIELTIEDGSA
jgi:hypothetical protein